MAKLTRHLSRKRMTKVQQRPKILQGQAQLDHFLKVSSAKRPKFQNRPNQTKNPFPQQQPTLLTTPPSRPPRKNPQHYKTCSAWAAALKKSNNLPQHSYHKAQQNNHRMAPLTSLTLIINRWVRQPIKLWIKCLPINSLNRNRSKLWPILPVWQRKRNWVSARKLGKLWGKVLHGSSGRTPPKTTSNSRRRRM